MAGALREIAANDIQKDFRNVDTGTSRIILLQGGERLLPALAPKLGDRAKHDLEAMGVEVRLKARVTNVDAGGVWIGEKFVPAENVIWAAGVEAPTLLRTLGVETDKSGRVVVGPDLSVPGHPNVFVLGDAAAAKDAKTGQPVPGLAPAAMQMGRYVGEIIRDEITRGVAPADRPPFHYRDKGTMATIGKRRAVADIRGWRFGGVLAWLMWSLVHITFLIGFRSKFFVMAGWIYDYLANSREARLITGNFKLRVRQPLGKRSHVTIPPAGTAADDPAASVVSGDGRPEGFAD
jgi:NADH dehydrogenase